MGGYELTNDKGSAIVRALKSVTMGGNIYYPSWLHHIRFPNSSNGELGLPNSTAVLILAEIVFWYRPIIDREERTSVEILRKRFKGRFLRKSRQEFADLFGISLKQVSVALDCLESCGVIKRHIIKREKLPNGTNLYNIMEIELIPQRLEEITTATECLKEVHKQTEFLQEFQDTHHGIPTGQTYTQNTNTQNTYIGDEKKSTKQTSVKTDSPKPSPASRKQKEVWNAIRDHMGITATGRIAIIERQMLGKIERTSTDYPSNFDPPATAQEVEGFVKWWKLTYPNGNLPLSPPKLQDHFYKFRETGKPRTRINRYGNTEEWMGDGIGWIEVWGGEA